VVELDKLIRLVAVALATDAVSVMVAAPFDHSYTAACMAAAAVILANRIAVQRHAVDQLAHVPHGTAHSAASFGSTCMGVFDGSDSGIPLSMRPAKTMLSSMVVPMISTIATT